LKKKIVSIKRETNCYGIEILLLKKKKNKKNKNENKNENKTRKYPIYQAIFILILKI
jgi:hypothetical protein